MRGGDVLDRLGLSLAVGATEIHLVRHADASAYGEPSRSYDQYDEYQLNERGRLQAQAVAERFDRLEVAAVYSSPIKRARETAAAIAERRGLGVTEEQALREVEIGRIDEPLEMNEQLTALAVLAMRDGSWSGIDGTESSAAVRSRMTAALDAIAARHRGERVIAVSHAGAINAYVGVVAASSHDFVFPLANASVTVVRVGERRRLLMSVNETDHLRDLVYPAFAR